jgi:hypothetical protein
MQYRGKTVMGVFMSSIQAQRNAMAQIISIEEQLPEYAAPSKMYQIFQQFTTQEAAPGKPAAFILKDAAPDRAASERVHEQMKGILKLVSENRTAIPPEFLSNFERFQRQMQQFDTRAAEMGEVQRAPQPVQQKTYRVVKEIKETIAKPFRPFWSEGMWVQTFTAGIMMGIGVANVASVSTLAVVSGLTAVSLGLGLAIPFFLIVPGLIGLAFVFNQFRHRKLAEEAFRLANTPDQIVPLFSKLAPEAQARLFVELGPDFRAKLCEWNERENHDTGLQQLADLVGVLQDDNASVEDKRQAFQALPLKKLKPMDIYAFQYQQLKRLLIEKEMTGGTLILQRGK